ncbi:MAG: signal peptidase I [Oryzihumus sp.]
MAVQSPEREGLADASKPEPHSRDQRDTWGLRRLVASMVVLLVIFVLTHVFLVQGFFIPTSSMEPTLHGCSACDGDRVLVDRMAVRTDAIHRGDVVVFRDSKGWLPHPSDASAPVVEWMELAGLAPDESGENLVKRVIGLDGDRVEARGGVLYVNGVRLLEPYLPPGVRASATDFAVTVPDDHLWVMGDNRDDSADSRSHLNDPGGPFIAEADVVGKAFAIVWPLQRSGAIDAPPTFDEAALARPD